MTQCFSGPPTDGLKSWRWRSRVIRPSQDVGRPWVHSAYALEAHPTTWAWSAEVFKRAADLKGIHPKNLNPSYSSNSVPTSAPLGRRCDYQPALHAFDNDLALPMLPQPSEARPDEIRINVIPHDPVDSASASIVLGSLFRHGRAKKLSALTRLSASRFPCPGLSTVTKTESTFRLRTCSNRPSPVTQSMSGS